MAIAYFIPDQAKLLARTSRHNNGSQNQAQPSTTNPPTSEGSEESQRQQQERRQQQQNRYSNFRANFWVPLARQQGAMSSPGEDQQDFGCWELLAQIFCYALRIHSHNAQSASTAPRTSTVIEISFEISTGPEEADDSQTMPDNEDGNGRH